VAITQLPVALLVQLTLGTLVATALALFLAPQIAELLIRFRARRLPDHLAERYSEEWIAEVRSIVNRFRKLTFAIAISVMRSKTLVEAEEGLPGLFAAPVVLSFEDVRAYSEFWSRLPALVIDVVLQMATATAVVVTLRSRLPTTVIQILLLTAWLLVLQVYFVRRFGGSPGKLLLKLRIVAMDSGPLTYRHALLRALPDYSLAIVGILISVWAVAHVDPGALEGLSRSRQSELLTATIPVWIRWPFTLAQIVWALGDLIVFIQSYERRAWHDLIAGTVVVYKIPRVVGSLSDNPPVGSTSAYR
jgi:uncharacterized RDD family membrane protein YckC